MALQAPVQARFPFRSSIVIERAQRRRVRRIVEYAWDRVPYYAETMKRRGLTPADIRNEGDRAKLPILDPEHLRRDPDYFVSQKGLRSGFLVHRTSGSTG